jgi:hypothetical protein
MRGSHARTNQGRAGARSYPRILASFPVRMVRTARMRESDVMVTTGQSGPSTIVQWRSDALKGNHAMPQNFIYRATDGGHIASSKVNIRKAPADPDKLKPYRFIPTAANGTDRVKVERYTVNAETFAAWLDASDSDARMAVLAGITPLVAASNLTPTRPQVLAALGMFGVERWTEALDAGWVAYPSDRTDKATSANGAKRALSESEKTSAAVADMFADLEAERVNALQAEAEAERDAEALAALQAGPASPPEPTESTKKVKKS